MLVNKLFNQFDIKITEDMELMDLCEKMDDVGVSYYYASYNDEDILVNAKDEGIDDIVIYEFKSGFIGFQEGIIW